jgi:hypothetical protein
VEVVVASGTKIEKKKEARTPMLVVADRYGKRDLIAQLEVAQRRSVSLRRQTSDRRDGWMAFPSPMLSPSSPLPRSKKLYVVANL